MAVVELFSEDEAGNNFYDFITDFRDVINPGEADEERIIKRLINEAYLEFYIDESALEIGTDAPNRIFVYDLKNNIPIIDVNHMQAHDLAHFIKDKKYKR